MIGGICTIILYLFLTVYLGYLSYRMYNGADDTTTLINKGNDLKNGNNQIDFKDSRLLPSL